MLFVANSTPIVDLLSRLNSLRVKRERRFDLPTPESPIRTTATQTNKKSKPPPQTTDRFFFPVDRSEEPQEFPWTNNQKNRRRFFRQPIRRTVGDFSVNQSGEPSEISVNQAGRTVGDFRRPIRRAHRRFPSTNHKNRRRFSSANHKIRQRFFHSTIQEKHRRFPSANQEKHRRFPSTTGAPSEICSANHKNSGRFSVNQ